MLLMRLHRRFAAWMALLSLVLGALAPTVTQAMVAGGDRADWLEVCSVSGVVWVKADTGEARESSAGSANAVDHTPTSDARQHCQWCTLHGGADALPPVQALPALPPSPSAVPSALHSAPQAATVWAGAQSRAPPLTT